MHSCRGCLTDFQLLIWQAQARKSNTFLFKSGRLTYCLCPTPCFYLGFIQTRWTKHSLVEPNSVSLSTEQQVSTLLLQPVPALSHPQLFLTIQDQVWLALFSCELVVSSLSRLFDCFRIVLLFNHPLVWAIPHSWLLLTAIGCCFHETLSIFEALWGKRIDYYFKW